ncbi:MAG: response regulator [Desulfobacterales bacterium]
MTLQTIHVLLVEDDDDDAFLFQEMLQDAESFQFVFDRVSSYDAAIKKVKENRYDVYVFDYYLGAKNAMDLIEAFNSAGNTKPIIVLTGRQSDRIDVELLRKGAADFLEKARLDSYLLERSIRYAIERTRVLMNLNQSRKKIQDLSLKVLRAEENQRRAIALELHDGIGSNLASIKYGLDKIDRAAESGHTDLTRIIAAVQDTIEEIRRIHTELRPPILDELGLVMAVRWLCRKFQEHQANIKVDIHAELADEQIPDELKIVVFRVLQEALNNIAKHSQADCVSVFLGERGVDLVLLVEDNGQGFDWQSKCEDVMCEKGTGLDSMRERTELSGGVFQIQSKIGHGTRITSIWPKNREKSICTGGIILEHQTNCYCRRPYHTERNIEIRPGSQYRHRGCR